MWRSPLESATLAAQAGAGKVCRRASGTRAHQLPFLLGSGACAPSVEMARVRPGPVPFNGARGAGPAAPFVFPSPKHQQVRTAMPKLTLTSADGFEFNAYRADPEGKPRGGVVVIHEVWGINKWVRSV